MKKLPLLVAAALVAGTALTAFAQDPGPRRNPNAPGGPRQGGMMNRLAGVEKAILAKLNLTADQKAKIEALDKKHREEMQKLIGAQGGARPGGQPGGQPGQRPQMDPANREKLRQLMQKRREGLMAILTPAQREQYQKLMREEMQKLRQQGGANGQAGPRRGGAGAGAGAKP